MRKQGLKGFTLIEVLITLVVVAVLTLGVAPNLSSVVKRNRSAASINDMLASLQYARSEALTRGTSVILCRRQTPSDSDASCTNSNLTVTAPCSCATATTNSNADGWEDGWLVVADSDRSGAVSVGDDLLRVNGPIGGGFSLRGNTALADNVLFQADATVGNSMGSFFLCGPGTDTASDSERIRMARKISISLVGHSTAGDATSCGL